MDSLGALRAECGALVRVLRGLESSAFVVPTNCPPWDLGELVVHMADSVSLRRKLSDGDGRLFSAADYYRRPERGSEEYRRKNVEKTQRLAGSVPAGVTAVEWFERVAGETLAVLEGDDLGRVVEVPGFGVMRLGDWVATRVVAVAAHGLDVAISLGREGWTTEEALRVVRPVFVDLFEGEPAVELGWDDVAFLAVATGRRLLTDREREVLGERAGRFPLLS
ncbi:maleylpyruvate isomerase family mycothiol-dependent enzyme [Kutzneria chonburiensis]|uniref:Maleylpyruvate isomerase family mycothiol-dependent enzyme n=1 Tax=Kutzneria chonburiensis TaxID=1483604 RepID=A0ABV6N1V7_9PSEU|nr:maleylpyruvate isomerase family mycothiol-dependent enzyme [Kutzneria chonburiensis]